VIGSLGLDLVVPLTQAREFGPAVGIRCGLGHLLPGQRVPDGGLRPGNARCPPRRKNVYSSSTTIRRAPVASETARKRKGTLSRAAPSVRTGFPVLGQVHRGRRDQLKRHRLARPWREGGNARERQLEPGRVGKQDLKRCGGGASQVLDLERHERLINRTMLATSVPGTA
jgi:hypothetical protein